MKYTHDFDYLLFIFLDAFVFSEPEEDLRCHPQKHHPPPQREDVSLAGVWRLG